jgi:hypothetical protein
MTDVKYLVNLLNVYQHAEEIFWHICSMAHLFKEQHCKRYKFICEAYKNIWIRSTYDQL